MLYLRISGTRNNYPLKLSLLTGSQQFEAILIKRLYLNILDNFTEVHLHSQQVLLPKAVFQLLH